MARSRIDNSDIVINIYPLATGGIVNMHRSSLKVKRSRIAGLEMKGCVVVLKQMDLVSNSGIGVSYIRQSL